MDLFAMSSQDVGYLFYQIDLSFNNSEHTRGDWMSLKFNLNNKFVQGNWKCIDGWSKLYTETDEVYWHQDVANSC